MVIQTGVIAGKLFAQSKVVGDMILIKQVNYTFWILPFKGGVRVATDVVNVAQSATDAGFYSLRSLIQTVDENLLLNWFGESDSK